MNAISKILLSILCGSLTYGGFLLSTGGENIPGIGFLCGILGTLMASTIILEIKVDS
jgi:hypothetical protein